MKKNKKTLVILQVILLVITVLLISSCEAGNEITSVEVIQYPYKMVYVAGTANSLDMDGGVIRLHNRSGVTSDSLFGNWPFVTVRYEIDFAIPGEYEVLFYWGEIHIYTMTIQVVAPD